MSSPAKAASTSTKTDSGPKRPPLSQMVLDVLTEHKSSKGMSIQAIKSAVTSKYYTDTADVVSNKRLQLAIKKGLDATQIVRPKSSEEMGFRGFFLFNKALKAKTRKESSTSEQPAKEEKKATTTTTKSKTEKPTTIKKPAIKAKAAKPTSVSKSPTAKKAAVKPKTKTGAKPKDVKLKETPKSSKSSKAKEIVKRKLSHTGTPTTVSAADRSKATKKRK